MGTEAYMKGVIKAQGSLTQGLRYIKLYRLFFCYLKEKFKLKQLRVRHHENSLARIELLQEDFPKVLTPENMNLIKVKFKELGFNYVTFDLEGFHSGSMNEVLTLN